MITCAAHASFANPCEVCNYHDPVYLSSDGGEMNQAEETEDSQEGDVQV